MPCPAKELGNKAVDISTVSVAPVFRPAGFKGSGRISNSAIVKKGEERWT
jgi:hypothetical protein